MPDPEENSLSKIGVRGLVFHWKATTPQSPTPLDFYDFFADNSSQSWRNSPVSLQQFLQSRNLSEQDLNVLERSRVALSLLGENPKTYFVNMDAFGELEREDVALPVAAPTPIALDEDAVLIRETSNQGVAYFAVPRKVFTKLEDIDAGEAKIVVRRGAVAAAIPKNEIPYGTNCVLVNLTQLLPKGG